MADMAVLQGVVLAENGGGVVAELVDRRALCLAAEDGMRPCGSAAAAGGRLHVARGGMREQTNVTDWSDVEEAERLVDDGLLPRQVCLWEGGHVCTWWTG